MASGNSTMDLECSENPLTSTRIEDSSSMSLLRDNTLNDGFLIDSGSLSLSAVNESTRVDVDISNVAQAGSDMESFEASREISTISMINEGETVDESSDKVNSEEVGEEENTEDPSVNIEEEKNEVPDEELQEEDGGEEDGQENNENDYPMPQFPLSKVRKIMSICMNTEEEEEEDPNPKKKDKKGGTAKMVNKEAVYAMALATEYFVGTVGEMAGKITLSSKKKTMTLDHLKRALSDSEAFAFLEGCLQPSVIMGD